MRALNSGEVGVVTLAGIQGVSIFTSLLPTVSEVHNADPRMQTAFVEDMRAAEIMSTVLTMGIGVVVTWFMKTALPLWMAAVSCSTIVAAYEVLLRRVPNAH